MKKLMNIFNWCKNQEEKVLSNLEKKKYIVQFLEELSRDVKEYEIDDYLVDYIKKRLIKFNETKIKDIYKDI